MSNEKWIFGKRLFESRITVDRLNKTLGDR